MATKDVMSASLDPSGRNVVILIPRDHVPEQRQVAAGTAAEEAGLAIRMNRSLRRAKVTSGLVTPLVSCRFDK
jgi:hypothetical protein